MMACRSYARRVCFSGFGTAVEACSALGRDFWPVAFLDELQFMAALQLSASR